MSAFASLTDPSSRTYYDRKRTEGKQHNPAPTCLACRRIDVLHAILCDRSPTDIPSLTHPNRHRSLTTPICTLPDGAPIDVILDNLSANKAQQSGRGLQRTTSSCADPTYRSWANSIEAQCGPLRMLTMANSS